MFSSADVVCGSCGTRGTPKTVTKGSFLLELFLFLCFFIPGLLYAIWRSTTKHKACRTCGSPNLVPADSPIGREIIQKYPVPAPTKEAHEYIC